MSIGMNYGFLADKIFTLRKCDGHLETETCSFGPTGNLVGYRNGRHSSYEVIDGNLYFRDINHNLSDIFDKISIVENNIVWHGRLHTRPNDYWIMMWQNCDYNLHDLPMFIRGDSSFKRPEAALAVLIRTHLADAKFNDMMTRLHEKCGSFDVYGLIDETRGSVDTDFNNVIRFSEASCTALGLTRGQPHLFHQYGDVAMSYAVRELEGYKYYAMFDDDVEFTQDGAAFCGQIIESLQQTEMNIDFVGLDYKFCPTEHGYGTALRRLLPDRLMYYSYYPFVLLSARAASFLFVLRQLEFAKGLSIEKRVMCEGFVPSLLTASGFNCIDLNDLIPGCYSRDNMILQYSGFGLPMSAQIQTSGTEQMIHAVYSDEEFLARLLKKCTVSERTNWDKVRDVLRGPLGRSIPSAVLEIFLGSAPRYVLEDRVTDDSPQTIDLGSICYGSEPDSATAAMTAAADAVAVGDIVTAQSHWSLARSSTNPPLSAWVLSAEQPGCADPISLLQEAYGRFPDSVRVIHDLARACEKKKDWVAAANHWTSYIARIDNQWWAYAALAAALRAQNRGCDADAVLQNGIMRLPTEPQMVAEPARAAEGCGDFQKAILLWDNIIIQFPTRWIGYRGKAHALSLSGHAKEADEVIERNAPRLPSDADALHDLARLAERQRDWKRAESVWRSFLAVERRVAWAYLSMADTLREQSRYFEAEEVLRDARRQFPEDANFPKAAARCAEMRGDFLEAASHWQVVAGLCPKTAEAALGEASMLRRQGQIEAADEVISAAMTRLPDEPSLLEAYGLNAIAANDWSGALARLEMAQRRFPASNDIGQRIFEVRLKIADSGDIAPSSVLDDRYGAAERNLVMQFESLGGGGHGCEFGIFQRHFGAEPLGLLRWADIFPDQLSAALETDFDGVGEPEFTTIFVPESNASGEYWTIDTRYHMAMRSFVQVADVPLDRMRRQVTKRFKYLSRKLTDDLRSGEKVFVYKNMKRNLTKTELERLHAACRRYGSNTLLYIRYEDVTHPSGTVVAEDDGLLIGYVDRFSHSPSTDEFLGSSADVLLQICKNAMTLWENRRRC